MEQLKSIDKILSPFKIRAEREENNTESFSYEPLNRGFGYTIGNSLRRILLSSIRGSRVVAIEGNEITHDMSRLPGISEDMLQICFNLNSVRLAVPGNEVYNIKLDLHNHSGPVYASHIQTNSGITICNPELFLFNMDGSKDISMTLIVESNTGICHKIDLSSYNSDLMTRIYLHDQYFFSPILNVKLSIEEYTLGRSQTVYDRLIMTIETDGSIKPAEAISNAAYALRGILSTFINSDIIYADEEDTTEVKNEYDEDLFIKITDMSLSTRAVNSLVNAGINFLGDLLSQDPSTIQSKITNFGQKSYKEVADQLVERGYQWTDEIDWPSSPEVKETLYQEIINRR